MADLDLAYRPGRPSSPGMIRTGEISPVEAVRNSLARIADVNPKLNAFCFVYEEEALAHSREAERAIRDGRPLGPFARRADRPEGLHPHEGQAHPPSAPYARPRYFVPDADAVLSAAA